MTHEIVHRLLAASAILTWAVMLWLALGFRDELRRLGERKGK